MRIPFQDMPKSNIFVGLEIGTSKICVVVAEMEEDGGMRILGVGRAPSRGVRKGEIVDFETVQQCVTDALADAEQKSDVTIRTVYLGVTGGHISSLNNRGFFTLPDEQDEVTAEDVEEVSLNAREVNIPEDHSFLHSINQHFYLDGNRVHDPVGMLGRRLEADFHIVHGINGRLKNSIRCVKEIPMEVEEVLLNGLASALVVLDQTQKEMGALVLDIGGGTTDFLVYRDGVVVHSGVLAVGGDHVTNDISMGLRIPMGKAEKLKIEEGSVVLGNSLPGDTVVLQDDTSFAGREIERETLNNIIHLRMKEVFELIKRRLDEENILDYLGAGVVLTGGASQANGLAHLAEEVFGLPARVAHAQMVSGVTNVFEDPQYSTAIGIVKYGQAVMEEAGTAAGWWPPAWWPFS